MNADEQFYLLTHGVLDKLMDAKLTAAEWKLWAYLTKLDSWGDRYVDLPDTLTVMQELGISKATYYRAIAKIQQLELFDVQDKGFAVRNLTCRKSKKSVSKMRLKNQKCESSLKNETEKSEMRQLSQKRENQSPESSQSEDSNSPQTSSDYSDFIHTLSEGEREIFLEFGRKKAANLPHPPELPDKWIAANFTELYKQFLASSAGREAKQEAIARKYDWENDPRLMDWLHKAYWEGHPWAVENEFEREERLAFLMWAQKTNAYAGRIADEPA